MEQSKTPSKILILFRLLQRSHFSLNILYLPALVLFGLLVIYPFILSFKWSMTDWDGYSQNFNYVGFQQYFRILSDPDAFRTFINTLIYGFGSTLLQNVLGLAYALFLQKQTWPRSLMRMIVYFPVILSPLLMGFVFYFMFQYDRGALNDLLIALGLEPVDWLGNGWRAVMLMTLINSYQFMGVAMMIYLAGLKAIPHELVEAAIIDGANRWRVFFHITLPMLWPAITVSVLINIIGGLKLFDVIFALTRGGPGYSSQSLSTMMYDLYFSRQDAGYAAALGNQTFAIIVIFSLGLLLWLKRFEVER